MEKNGFFKLMDAAGINYDLLLDLAFETGLIKRKRLQNRQIFYMLFAWNLPKEP